MAGQFRYPSHWSDDVDGAINATEGQAKFSTPFVARMEDRDRYLEDFLGGAGLGGFTFEFVGPLIVSVSNALPAPVDITIAGFDFTFNVQSTSAVVVQYDLNGVNAGTTTIPANVSLYNAAFARPIAMSAHANTLQVRIVTPGTGGAGLVAVPYSA